MRVFYKQHIGTRAIFRDFWNLLNINNTDKENNMSLMGFGFYETLGHLVEDSAEKEKGRVEFDAIRDRQIHIY